MNNKTIIENSIELHSVNLYLKDLINHKGLIINPNFKKELSPMRYWDRLKEIYYIENLLKFDRAINTNIIISEVNNRFTVIDGSARINAILGFTNNEFDIIHEGVQLKYYELKSNNIVYKRNFHFYFLREYSELEFINLYKGINL